MSDQTISAGAAPVLPLTGAEEIPLIQMQNGVWVNVTTPISNLPSTGGGGGGGGTGTVTSVGVASSTLQVTNTPVTTYGVIDVELPDTTVTPGSYTNTNLTVDAHGRITSAANGSSGGGGGGSGGTVTSVGITSSTLGVTGGPVTGSGNIDVELEASGVSPGKYSAATITVDSYGRVTTASAGSSSGGGVLVPSGSATTDTANFIAAYTAAMAGAVTLPWGGTYGTFAVITFAAGVFYINAPQAMMSGTALNKKYSGLKFQGQGSDLTIIVYEPTSAGAMCQNRFVLDVQWVGFTFYGSGSYAAQSDFLQSQEQNGASNIQFFNFLDCTWIGSWRNLVNATGGNNNSEWQFQRCSVTTSVTNNWFYTPPSVTCTVTAGNSSIPITNPTNGGYEVGTSVYLSSGTLGNLSGTYQILTNSGSAITIASFPTNSATTSGGTVTPNTSGSITLRASTDQIVNLWWNQCKFWPTVGSWMTLNYGGSVKISECDVSGWTPTATTYLFNLPGAYHAYGVCTFEADGLRIEHKSDYALLLNCGWNQGSIVFRGLDQSSQVQSRNAANQYVLVNFNNVGGPSIKWDSCLLIGQHVYTTSTNNYNLQSQVTYDTCTVMQYTQANAFVQWTNGGNSGGAPSIRFYNCRGSSSGAIAFDTDLYGSYALAGTSLTKTINIAGVNGSLPSGGASQALLFPQNCALTRIRLISTTATGAFNYKIQSTDSTPVVFATFSGTASAGLYQTQDVFVPLTSSTLWNFTILDAQNRSNFAGNIIIDYIW